jgi:hypothetical protein
MSNLRNASERTSAETSPSYRNPLTTPHPDAIVYLVQEPTIPKQTGKVIDTTPLMWWGKVRILMERTQLASFRPAQALVQIGARLKDFDPSRDYIAIAGGDALAQILVGAALTQYGHQHFYYLRFERTRLPDGSRDPSTGAYAPLMVPLSAEAAAEAMR